MFMILFTSILINLIIRSFQCEFVSSQKYTNNPNLATPLRIQKEEYWIRELGTATSYGCNGKIDGKDILSSPTCRSVNVMDIFNSAPRRKRIHGHRLNKL